METSDSFQHFRDNCIQALLDERVAAGHWEGELSTSALSTATAVVALDCVDCRAHRELIDRGTAWLVDHQNSDGGWGDTTRSFSNVSTTLLVWSALKKCRPTATDAIRRAENWIRDYVGSLNPDRIAEVVKARYGKDRTFSVPILMLCSICGTLGKKSWKRVLPLPYEMAACPREWFAAMQLPVVSYALPALIAIGRARFEHVTPLPWNPLYWIRQMTWPRVSKLLHEIQPASGGYLEAAPLTSFVTMALASTGKTDHPSVISGVRFLVETVRPDGSWPIDTNLATWATTLAVKSGVIGYNREQVLNWILGQQYQTIHPFTNSDPGGWAWTDLTGGVPDADDTPGAMLAIRELMDESTFPACLVAAKKAAQWLLDLQNRDGGIPTFCRGWGALPFDRSSPDLTAHTLRAWMAWYQDFDPGMQQQIDLGFRLGSIFSGAFSREMVRGSHCGLAINTAPGMRKTRPMEQRWCVVPWRRCHRRSRQNRCGSKVSAGFIKIKTPTVAGAGELEPPQVSKRRHSRLLHWQGILKAVVGCLRSKPGCSG